MKFWMRFPAKCLKSENNYLLSPDVRKQKQDALRDSLEEGKHDDFKVVVMDPYLEDGDDAHFFIPVTMSSTDREYLKDVFETLKDTIKLQACAEKPEDNKDLFPNVDQIGLFLLTSGEYIVFRVLVTAHRHGGDMY